MALKRRRDRVRQEEQIERLDRRMFVAGQMRSGTMWLHSVIKKNAHVPEKYKHVTHEQSKWRPMRLLTNWEMPGLHVEVGHTFALLPALLRKFPDTVLRFIIRDPIEHIESLCSQFRLDKAGEALTLANWHWSSLETALRMMEEREIPVKAWHFSAYTSSRGVRAFMDELGIPWQMPFDVLVTSHNATPTWQRVVWEEWGEPIRDMLLELWNSNKRVVKLHEEAHRPDPTAIEELEPEAITPDLPAPTEQEEQ